MKEGNGADIAGRVGELKGIDAFKCIYRAAGKKCVFYLSDRSLFSSASINVPDTRVT